MMYIIGIVIASFVSMLFGVVVASLMSATRCGECKARRMAEEYEKFVKENDDDD